MVHNSGPIAFAVLIILLLMSIFSWTIMISKWSRFGRAQTQNARFIRAFRKSTRLSEIAAVADQFKPSPLVAVFSEIHDEYQRQNGGRGMPRNPVALERALPLFQAGLSLSEVAEEIGLSKTSCHRLRARAAAMGLLDHRKNLPPPVD